MQVTLFQDNSLMFPIESCDMVLGAQWLCKWGHTYKLWEVYVIWLSRKVCNIAGAYPTFKAMDIKDLNKSFMDTA